MHVQTQTSSSSNTDSTHLMASTLLSFCSQRHYLSSIMETSQCSACGQFFTKEGNLTRHLHNKCSATLRHSQEQWKCGVLNVAKINHMRS
jgi:hypothetical protein